MTERYMYNGIMNVYKEAGYTSHDVVARLRGICKQKKIGHTGTLDPDAVGVLPVCFGSGTKLCDMLTDWDKEYITFDSKSCDYWKLVIQFVDGEEKIFLGKAKYPSNFEMFLHLNRRMLEEVKE